MRGEKTAPEVEAEFRKHYLVTGNIRGSARQVGIPERTGQDLADRANEDPEFTRARAAIYTRALPDAERMLVQGLQIALERLEQGPASLSELADVGAAKVTVQDPCPAYFRGIVDAYKALTANRKIDPTSGEEKPREVVITIRRKRSDGDGKA